MPLSIVLSVQPARFEAVAFKGELEANLAQNAGLGYDGVELAFRDPMVVDAEELLAFVARQELSVPAIGTGQAWGEERLSYSNPDPLVRRAAIERTKAHILGVLSRIGYGGFISGEFMPHPMPPSQRGERSSTRAQSRPIRAADR